MACDSAPFALREMAIRLFREAIADIGETAVAATPGRAHSWGLGQRR
jgi:hypothetical protein